MEDKVANLRRKYKGLRRGEEDALEVRNEALSVLEAARKDGDRKVLDEVEDMLIDIEFSIEENRCKCHRNCSSY